MTTLIEQKKRKLVHLILKKSLSDLWPIEFDNNSRKWDVDNLLQWTKFYNDTNLKEHIGAQLDCFDFVSNCNAPEKPLKPLDEVRQLMRYIFISANNKKNLFFSICNLDNADEPLFFLFVRPSIRLTPQGNPILIVSVLDLKVGEQLKTRGKFDGKEIDENLNRILSTQEYHLTSLQLKLAESVDLLRYSLRLNSTKIRPSAWQSKHLPLGEDSPWMASFLSLFYREFLLNCCHVFDPLVKQLYKSIDEHSSIDESIESSLAELLLGFCAQCQRSEGLTKCEGCKRISYCSDECRQLDLDFHRRQCSNV